MSSSNQVEFNILVHSSKAEKALHHFANVVDKTIGKAIKQTVTLEKSLSKLEKKLGSLGRDKGLDNFNTKIDKTEKNLGGLAKQIDKLNKICLLYTSPSPRDATLSRMPSSA